MLTVICLVLKGYSLAAGSSVCLNRRIAVRSILMRFVSFLQHIQSRLVRTVAEQNFRRVGGNTEVSTDVRVISASSQDLQAAIADDVLREDLYYRLGVISLSVAPLSSRREDIGALARHFVSEFADQLGCPPVKLGEDLLNAMRAYRWPGSVRQLRNVIETLMILADKSSDEPLGSRLCLRKFCLGQNRRCGLFLKRACLCR